MKAALVLAIYSAIVAARPVVARADDPKLGFEKYTLPNGLEVILAPDPSVPLVAVNVWYHVGSGDEVPGKSGFAHLFEHMMFQGSKNVGSDKHFEVLRKLGSDDINGTTNTDRTNYFEVVPSNQLETGAVARERSDESPARRLDKDELDEPDRRRAQRAPPALRQRAVQQGAVRAPGRALSRGASVSLPDDRQARGSRAASVDDVKAFYKTWYVPANATIALVGDFDVATAKQLVKKWFGSLPGEQEAGDRDDSCTRRRGAAARRRRITFAKLRQITFAWHSPAKYARGDADLDIRRRRADRAKAPAGSTRSSSTTSSSRSP